MEKQKQFRRWLKVALSVTVGASIWTLGGAFAAPPQAAQKPMVSDQVFKNIQVLKGISVDDFMGTMGVMTGSLSFDCSDCHTGAGTDTVNWPADTPRKIVARKMVLMVANINKENFGGRQVITCYSCHHGRDKPLSTPKVEDTYGEPTLVMDDILTQAEGQPPAAQIVDRYLKALGGEEKLAAIKNWVGTGNSLGFGGYGGGAKAAIYAKSPDERAMIITYADATRGTTTRSFDGKAAWLRTPLNVLGEYPLEGGELDGARLDAELSFPANFKKTLTKLRVGLPQTISDLPEPQAQGLPDGIGQDRLVDVVQGNGPHDMLTTLFFAHDTGLLLRVIRYAKSPIGRVPTLIDYTDYRDVNGVKMPFRMTYAWLNGRDAVQLTEVKTNVTIEPALFGKPSAARSR